MTRSPYFLNGLLILGSLLCVWPFVFMYILRGIGRAVQRITGRIHLPSFHSLRDFWKDI